MFIKFHAFIYIDISVTSARKNKLILFLFINYLNKNKLNQLIVLSMLQNLS